MGYKPWHAAAVALCMLISTGAAPANRTFSSDNMPTIANAAQYGPTKAEACELAEMASVAIMSTTSTTTASISTTTSTTTSTSATTTAATTTAVESTEPIPEPEFVIDRESPDYVWYYSADDICCLASCIDNEIGGSLDINQLTAVAWCVCNRIDSARWVEDTVYATISRANQFAYYGGRIDSGKCYDVAAMVLQDWNDEKNCPGYVGPSRSIPSDYLNFCAVGDGFNNQFSNDYNTIIPGVNYWFS